MNEPLYRRADDGRIIELGVKVEGLENDMKEVKDDVKCLLAKMNQAKGGWWMLITVAGVAGTMGALISKALPFLGSLPR